MVDRGLIESREKAKALIMAGQVYVNNMKSLKAGLNVKDGDCIEIRGEKMPYVSRGGYKLEKAVNEFGLRLENCICMDIGASTGGFTDCMLINGASKVYSIDVGYGQLAWKLRTDERVVNLERTNFRYVTHELVPEEIDFASVDVSFISLRLILPVMHSILKHGGEAVCLIKPQFEAGKDKIGKNGVVREIETHLEVVNKIYDFVLENGFSVLNLDFSPIKGPQGNIEYLIYIKKADEPVSLLETTTEQIVRKSHEVLNGGKAL
ncbi:MAG: TlyA family RNA methyltransferase [Faecalibacterium sp.]|nr:TlyA family RNA methyltransferase [Ruminococcus sp.]MCM1392721.1 TlyA family RNA methyltransferase [Ruminococcus sp.]MCM1485191.1 TlyA family RNA methyltransferase [Faecalibacterium sp.]